MSEISAFCAVAKNDREAIPCQICGRINQSPVFQRHDRFQIDRQAFNIVHCEVCDFFYVNPRPFPDELMKFYPDTYAFQQEAPVEGKVAKLLKRAEGFYRHQGLSHDVNRLLAVTRKKNGRILEIGCGTGDRLKLLKEKGFQVLGVEPANAAREYGEKYFGIPIAGTTMEQWQGPEQPQDAICIFNVLEHLPYPIAQLKRLASWLSNDGVLVIQIPNAASLQAKWLGPRWSSVDAPRDLFYFTPAAMRTAMEQAGLHIFKIEYGHHWMHPPTLISSLFPSLDPMVLWGQEGSLLGPFKKMLWAVLTLAAVPLALLARGLKQSSLMTVYARPDFS